MPVPLATQAELLAAAGEYQEALAVAALAAARAPVCISEPPQPKEQEGEQRRALLASPQGNWHPVAVRVCVYVQRRGCFCEGGIRTQKVTQGACTGCVRARRWA